ncbi:MAG: hypothetical protein J6B71_03550 [Clostridia bacterium]|nr:hypothetical protein [Clostridia bacterium]
MQKNTKLRIWSLSLLLCGVLVLILALVLPYSGYGEGAAMMFFVRLMFALSLDWIFALAGTVVAWISLRDSYGGGKVASCFLLAFGILFFLPLLILAIQIILL